MTVEAPVTTDLSEPAFVETLGFFEGLGLVSPTEVREVMSHLAPDLLFAGAIRQASSIHLHIKVDDVDSLPHAEILARGTRAESCTEGYVKYPFAGGST